MILLHDLWTPSRKFEVFLFFFRVRVMGQSKVRCSHIHDLSTFQMETWYFNVLEHCNTNLFYQGACNAYDNRMFNEIGFSPCEAHFVRTSELCRVQWSMHFSQLFIHGLCAVNLKSFFVFVSYLQQNGRMLAYFESFSCTCFMFVSRGTLYVRMYTRSEWLFCCLCWRSSYVQLRKDPWDFFELIAQMLSAPECCGNINIRARNVGLLWETRWFHWHASHKVLSKLES